MEVQALCEREAELFEMVKAALSSRLKAPISNEIQVAVFNSVHNWQMNKAIDAQQTARYQAQQQVRQTASQAAQDQGRGSQAGGSAKPRSDVKCVECGRFLTVGEKKYCDDADKQYRCYQCTKKRE